MCLPVAKTIFPKGSLIENIQLISLKQFSDYRRFVSTIYVDGRDGKAFVCFHIVAKIFGCERFLPPKLLVCVNWLPLYTKKAWKKRVQISISSIFRDYYYSSTLGDIRFEGQWIFKLFRLKGIAETCWEKNTFLLLNK